jgi:hypothetical protein
VRPGFDARILTVLIASPSDTRQARDLVEAAVQSWNRDRARTQKVVLLPLRWEVDAVPELGGGDGQAAINRQLVDQADIVIGLFHSRLGQPTPRGASGTAEEIERSMMRGARVHVLFSEMALPHDVDTTQLEACREFKRKLQDQGLVGSYASLDDLNAKVRHCLDYDVPKLVPVISPDSTDNELGRAPGAILRARYESEREPRTDSLGRVQMRTRGERLIVENLGTVAAEDVKVEIEPVGEGEPPLIVDDSMTAERIPPQGSIAFLLALHLGVANQWRVTYRWREGSESFEEFQSITAL